jgi:hypothetical protein
MNPRVVEWVTRTGCQLPLYDPVRVQANAGEVVSQSRPGPPAFPIHPGFRVAR